MSKVIRRHWLSSLMLVAILGLLVGLLAVHTPRSSLPAQGLTLVGASGLTEDRPISGVDEVAYGRIRQLREHLTLSNSDLAAMGCTAAQTKQVLAALAAYEKENAAVLQNAHQSELRERAAMRELWRKVNVGPKNDAVTAQIPAGERRLQQAIKSKHDLWEGAAARVTPILSGAQSNAWAIARANAALGAPSDLRYAPALTAQQIKAWKSARDRQALLTSGLLGSLQVMGVQEARVNRQAHADEVILAEHQVLPDPSISAQVVQPAQRPNG